MLSGVINRKNILFIIFYIALFILICATGFYEIGSPELVLLPFGVAFIIAHIIYIILNLCFKDKFISKIYLFSALVHFIFLLFWHLFKYYMLGYHMPTENTFIPFTIDNAGALYHAQGSYMAQHFSFELFKEKMVGGPFSKIIAVLYYYFGCNPFNPCLLNSLVAGFTATFIYYIGKITLSDVQLAKIYSILSIITFSHIMNTTVMMRDGYITLFMFSSIVLSYWFYKTKKISAIILTLLSLYFLFSFRSYAGIILFLAIVTAFLTLNLQIKQTNKIFRVNRLSLLLIILSPLILAGITFVLFQFSTLFSVVSMQDLIEIRENSYAYGAAEVAIDFGALYSKFFLLPFIVGYIYLFLAPFPWEWIYPRRIVYVPDVIILHLFLPSFFRNIKQIFIEKKYFPTVCFFATIFMFSIYCITLGNTGAIHRLRGPFIPMIYLIAMTHPDKFLSRILNFIKKCNVV